MLRIWERECKNLNETINILVLFIKNTYQNNCLKAINISAIQIIKKFIIYYVNNSHKELIYSIM